MSKLMGMLVLYAIASLAAGQWLYAFDPISGVLLSVLVFLVLIGLHYALTRP